MATELAVMSRRRAWTGAVTMLCVVLLALPTGAQATHRLNLDATTWTLETAVASGSTLTADPTEDRPVRLTFGDTDGPLPFMDFLDGCYFHFGALYTVDVGQRLTTRIWSTQFGGEACSDKPRRRFLNSLIVHAEAGDRARIVRRGSRLLISNSKGIATFTPARQPAENFSPDFAGDWTPETRGRWRLVELREGTRRRRFSNTSTLNVENTELILRIGCASTRIAFRPGVPLYITDKNTPWAPTGCKGGAPLRDSVLMALRGRVSLAADQRLVAQGADVDAVYQRIP